MNLAVLKKSRRKPEVGDVFVMAPPDGSFLFGRVIAKDVNAGGFPGANLIYVYRRRSSDKSKVPELLRGELLVPPLMLNDLPWSRGYLEFVENRPLGSLERLGQHCFADGGGSYFDEYGNRLAGPVEPVGVWGLHSFRTLDEEISHALGIGRSSD